MRRCDKHAYLIMAHNQPSLLKKLLILIDDERNDIYIHIDKKMKNFKREEYENVVKKSPVFWTERTDVKWGDYSQVNCEMLLLKEATKIEHQYYHLLSGVDLPLKKQDEIHEFFNEYNGLEFIGEDHPSINEGILDRIKFYHILRDKKGTIGLYIKQINVSVQKKLKVNRLKNYLDISFQKGRNWFSITHDLALYVIQKENWIQKMFKWSQCGDEMFLQTVARNSEFSDKICNTNTMPKILDTRYIDWKRGEPYIFRNEDYVELKNAKALFARKFDEKIDNQIIEKLYRDLQ